MLIHVNNKIIGEGNPVFFIAEAGVNHNGSMVFAKKLIDISAEAGADAVKFQSFKTENIITPTATGIIGLINLTYNLFRNEQVIRLIIV